MKNKILLLMLTGLLGGMEQVSAQLTGVLDVPSATYPDLAVAFDALNTQGVGAGGVTINITADQTCPVDGFQLGSTALNATLSSTNTLTIEGNGNAITAWAGTRSNVSIGNGLNDGMFVLKGIDYTTISNLVFNEMATNTTEQLAMENAIAFYNLSNTQGSADGCQYITVTGCTFNMSNLSQYGVAIYAAAAIFNSFGAYWDANSGDVHRSLTVHNNNFADIYNGVAFSGTYDVPAKDLVVTNNIFTGVGGGSAYCYGMYANYVDTLVFNGNTASGDTGQTTRGYLAYSEPSFDSDYGYYEANNNDLTLQSGTEYETTYGIYFKSRGYDSKMNNNTVKFGLFPNIISGDVYPIYRVYSGSNDDITLEMNGNNIVSQTLPPTTGRIELLHNVATRGGTRRVHMKHNTVRDLVRNSSGQLSCVYAGSADSVDVSYNVIDGITVVNNSVSSKSDVLAVDLQGSGVDQRIHHNSVSNITISGTSTATNGRVIGLYYGTSSTFYNAGYDNTISNLSFAAGTTTGDAIGILINSGTSDTYRNVIRGISAHQPFGEAYGIFALGIGPVRNIYNNFISDLTAPDNRTREAVRGMFFFVDATVTNVSFNTIYPSSAGPLTGSTGMDSNFGASGIELYSFSRDYIIKNNIINITGTASGDGYIAALKYSFKGSPSEGIKPPRLAASNNIYHAPYIYGEGWNINEAENVYYISGGVRGTADPSFNTSCGLYKAFMGETGTFSEDNLVEIEPGIFVPSGLSYAEAGATYSTVPVITTDFDSVSRATFPDIGALEFDGTAIDGSAPLITYASIPSLVCLAPPALSAVVTDFTGVETTAGLAPRLWFKKSTELNELPATNTSSDNGWKWVEAPNTSSPFSFSVNYDLLTAPAAIGDTIEYFVTAQDLVDPTNVGTNKAVYPLGYCPPNVGLSAGAFPVSGYNAYRIVEPSVVTSLASPSIVCVSEDVTLSLGGDPSSGAGYQWQSSPIWTGAWTDIAGATTASYTVAGVNEATEYRCIITCGGIPIAASPSQPVAVGVNQPEILSTSPGSACGPDPVQVNLGATANAGSEVYWYDAATGGSLLATGTNFTTPPISANTDFYASAAPGTVVSGGRLQYTSLFAYTKEIPRGVIFTTASAVTLDSIGFITIGDALTVTVRLYNADGTAQIGPNYTFNIAPNGGAYNNPLGVVLPASIPIPQAGTYRLFVTGLNGGDLYRDQNESGFPYPVGDILQITGSVKGLTSAPITNEYWYFYKISARILCASPRVAVTASVFNEGPVCPADRTVCAGSAAFALSGALPTGGIYSGSGVSGNMFDPGVAGTGVHEITYTNCGQICTFNITVATLTRLYVDKDATGNNDGTSWTNAFTDLQTAIDNPCGATEIWVAAGTYLPERDPFGNATPTDPRDKTFYLKDGIAIYGGFAGTETERSQRNPATNITILSGDIGTPNDPSDNCYHVAITVLDGPGTVLDGFTVTKGTNDIGFSSRKFVEGYLYYRGSGAGMNIQESAITVNNCILEDNAGFYGGGMYVFMDEVAPIISNCRIINNTANDSKSDGLGMAIETYGALEIALTNCDFSANTGGEDTGGAVYLYADGNNKIKFTSCTFSDNANAFGGAVYTYTTSGINQIDFTDCTFSGNTAEYGGAVYQDLVTNVDTFSFTNCLFVGNQSTEKGGALYFSDGTSILTNCTLTGNSTTSTTENSGAIYAPNGLAIVNSILWDNTSAAGGSTHQMDFGSTTPNVTYSTVQGTPLFAGTGNINANPLFTDAANGDYTLQGCSPAINAGDNAAVGTITDLAGETRIQEGAVDMGAFESSLPVILIPAVSIAAAPGNSIASGTPVTFTATPTNGGATPVYQWKKNGNPVGMDSNTYTDAALANGDEITVEMTSSYPCADPAMAVSDVLVLTVCSSPVRYVKAVATGNGSGENWDNASDDLQAMMDSPCATEVWVAAGTYKPERYPTGCTNCTSDRDFAFVLKDGIKVYGGFAGTETNLGERTSGNETILSGDIDNNNILDAQNTYHVVLSINDSDQTLLDGFTVTNGYANGSGAITIEGRSVRFDEGGGLVGKYSHALFSNNLFSNNSTSDDGGVYIDFGSANFENCRFQDNFSGDGGGLYTHEAEVLIESCHFENNESNSNGGGCHFDGGTLTVKNCVFVKNITDDDGGGIYYDADEGIVKNCTFVNNDADEYGGGLYVNGNILTVDSCVFDGNSTEAGGGIYFDDEDECVVKNCTFVNNNAEDYGGGVYIDGGDSFTLEDCVFDGNSSDDGGGIYAVEAGEVMLKNCTFENNDAEGDGGGLYINEGELFTIDSCVFDGNGNSTNSGGAIYYADADECIIKNCTFVNNKAEDDGGGLYVNEEELVLEDCLFDGNSANKGGGLYGYYPPDKTNRCVFRNNTAFSGSAVYAEDDGNYKNCLFYENTASSNDEDGGGAFFADGASNYFENCTFATNHSPDGIGGGLVGDGSDIELVNCIFWGNTHSDANAATAQIFNTAGTVAIAYSTLQDGVPDNATDGGDNIFADPLFTDTANGDYTLLGCSPAINVGNNNGVSATDLAGNARIQESTVDMGAYENVTSPGIITAIAVANASDCDGQNTTCTTDDTFTADVTVTYESKPSNGTLSLSGPTLVGTAPSANVSDIGATSYTFTGVTMKADGDDIDLTASFSEGCSYQDDEVDTAPSCVPSFVPGNITVGGFTCPGVDGNYTPAGTLNGAPYWSSDYGPDEYRIQWTGSNWQIYRQSEGYSISNNSNSTGSIDNLPCFGGWDNAGGCLFTGPFISGGCGSLSGGSGPACDITDISIANASSCNDNGSTDANDDYFTADVTVTFQYAPEFKTLVLTDAEGVVLATKEASDDLLCTTTWTFEGVQLPANGQDVVLTAEFRETNRPADQAAARTGDDCIFTSEVLMTAPASCSCVPPTFTACPTNKTAFTSANACTAVVDYVATADGVPSSVITYAFTGLTTGTGNGSGTGTTFNKGVTTVTLTATNDCGAPTCQFTVTVTDNVKPLIACPANRTVNADQGQCSSVQTYDVTTTDNCSASTTQTSGLSSGTAFPVGVTTNGFTATDDAGNTSTCAFTITVLDNQPPTIACPANRTVNADQGQCSSVQTYDVTTTDNCSATTQPTAGLSSGAAFPTGTTINAFLATDAAGNTAICSFSIRVLDTQLPVVTCPANTTLGIGTNCSAPLGSYGLANKSDNCSTAIFETQSPVAGTIVTGHNTAQTVTLTATDASGNTASCSFVVTLKDVLAPSITCPANIIRPTDPNLCSAAVTYATPIYSDNCSGGGATHINGGTSGSAFAKGTTTVNWQATDGVGLTKTCSFTITVNDVQAPVITCPANMVRNSDAGQCSAVVSYPTPKAADNCSLPTGQPQWVSGGTSPTASGANSTATFQKGANIVTWRATDGAGLTKTCTFRVTVNDIEAPTLTCPAPMSLTTAANTCSSVATYTNPTFTDNCALTNSTATRINGLVSGSTFPLGNNNVVFQATDAAGNTRRCTMVITVTDNQPPVITCPLPVVATGTGVPCRATVFYGSTTASDNCAGPLTPFLVTGLASGSQFPAGVTTNTFRAVAPNGQSSECSFSVTVDCGSGMGNNGVEVRNTNLNMQHGDKLELKLAPNPALSTVTVSIEGVGAGGGTLLVFDAVGRLVLRQVIAENQQTAVFQVDGAEFAPGMYRVNLRTETGMVTKTLVVVK